MVLIQEVDDSPSSSVDIERALQLKEAGNASFQSKEFKTAIEHYSSALQFIGDDSAVRAVLHSNSAACYIQLNTWDKAVNEATNAINVDPKNVKAYHRKATALRKASNIKEAVETLQLGLSAIQSTATEEDVSPLTKLLVSYEKLMAKADGNNSSSFPSSNKKKDNTGFINKKGGGLFADTPKQSEGDRVLSRLKESISFANNSNSVHIDGMFQKLLDRKYFEKTVFPGLTAEQREGCPRSLRELLDTPLYSEALEKEAVPEALKKAKSVMDNVKKKGAAAGDFMDEQTEATLWPQVVNEALARSIVSMVQKLHRRQHLALSRDPRFEATTPMPEYYSQMKLFGVVNGGEGGEAPPWEVEQLDDEIFAKLSSLGFGNLDEFMGDEWPNLILEDAIRFIGSSNKPAVGVEGASGGAGVKKDKSSGDGVLYPLPVPERTQEGLYGHMAWLPAPQVLLEDFPALAEIVTNLHALPFELNRLFASQTLDTPAAPVSQVPNLQTLRLTRAMPSATALLRFKPGNFQPMRIDCDSGLLRKGSNDSMATSSANDSGYRITALYFLPLKGCSSAAEGKCGGELRLRNVLNALSPEQQADSSASSTSHQSTAGDKDILEDGIVEFAPLSDRLMLWRSDIVGNERRLFTGSKVDHKDGVAQSSTEEMYAILFWMHGVEKKAN